MYNENCICKWNIWSYFALWFLDEDSVARSISIKLQNAIKQKASQDEILEVLKEIPDEDGEQTNPLRVIILLPIDLDSYKYVCNLIFNDYLPFYSFLDIRVRTIFDAIRIKEFFSLIRCDCQISPNIQGKGYSFVVLSLQAMKLCLI